MKWQIWGKEEEDGATFTLVDANQTSTSGKTMAQLVAEDGERLYTEFETPEEPGPDGLGPAVTTQERELHFRAAVVASLLYHEGLADGQDSPRRTCAIHAGQVHGGEAEELRKGIEDVLRFIDCSDDGTDELSAAARRLRQLLEDVDARDSLAYRETIEGKIRGYTRFMQRKAPEDS